MKHRIPYRRMKLYQSSKCSRTQLNHIHVDSPNICTARSQKFAGLDTGGSSICEHRESRGWVRGSGKKTCSTSCPMDTLLLSMVTNQWRCTLNYGKRADKNEPRALDGKGRLTRLWVINKYRSTAIASR